MHLLLRAVEDAADALRIADSVPIGSSSRFLALRNSEFPASMAACFESIGLLRRLKLRDGRDLAQQAPQPGIAWRDERPVVRAEL